MFYKVEKVLTLSQIYKRDYIVMDFSEIPDNPFIFLSWVTALGFFLSLTEATLKIKREKISSTRRREEIIGSLYPKKLA